MTTVQSIFEKWAESGPQLDKRTCDAIDAVLAHHPFRGDDDKNVSRTRNRNAAAEMWAEIARGAFSVEHLAFVQEVAQVLTDIEIETKSFTPAERKAHLARATGLGGTLDRYEEIRERMEQHFSFHETVTTADRLDFLEAHRHLIPWEDTDAEGNPSGFNRQDMRGVLRAIQRSYLRQK